jgi:hypothetical protein
MMLSFNKRCDDCQYLISFVDSYTYSFSFPNFQSVHSLLMFYQEGDSDKMRTIEICQHIFSKSDPKIFDLIETCLLVQQACNFHNDEILESFRIEKTETEHEVVWKASALGLNALFALFVNQPIKAEDDVELVESTSTLSKYPPVIKEVIPSRSNIIVCPEPGGIYQPIDHGNNATVKEMLNSKNWMKVRWESSISVLALFIPMTALTNTKKDPEEQGDMRKNVKTLFHACSYPDVNYRKIVSEERLTGPNNIMSAMTSETSKYSLDNLWVDVMAYKIDYKPDDENFDAKKHLSVETPIEMSNALSRMYEGRLVAVDLSLKDTLQMYNSVFGDGQSDNLDIPENLVELHTDRAAGSYVFMKVIDRISAMFNRLQSMEDYVNLFDWLCIRLRKKRQWTCNKPFRRSYYIHQTRLLFRALIGPYGIGATEGGARLTAGVYVLGRTTPSLDYDYTKIEGTVQSLPNLRFLAMPVRTRFLIPPYSENYDAQYPFDGIQSGFQQVSMHAQEENTYMFLHTAREFMATYTRQLMREEEDLPEGLLSPKEFHTAIYDEFVGDAGTLFKQGIEEKIKVLIKTLIKEDHPILTIVRQEQIIRLSGDRDPSEFYKTRMSLKTLIKSKFYNQNFVEFILLYPSIMLFKKYGLDKDDKSWDKYGFEQTTKFIINNGLSNKKTKYSNHVQALCSYTPTDISLNEDNYKVSTYSEFLHATKQFVVSTTYILLLIIPLQNHVVSTKS